MAGSSHAQSLLDLKQRHAGLRWTETVINSSEDLLAKVLERLPQPRQEEWLP